MQQGLWGMSEIFDNVNSYFLVYKEFLMKKLGG